MVTPPKCKVCGSAHWGAQHVWANRSLEPSVKPIINMSSPVVRMATPPVSELRKAIDEIGTKPKRDRAAYMREYRAAHPKP